MKPVPLDDPRIQSHLRCVSCFLNQITDLTDQLVEASLIQYITPLVRV